jgi:hypothetical protein
VRLLLLICAATVASAPRAWSWRVEVDVTGASDDAQAVAVDGNGDVIAYIGAGVIAKYAGATGTELRPLHGAVKKRWLALRQTLVR